MTKKNSLFLLVTAIVLLLWCGFCQAASSTGPQVKPVFQIGTFDRSSYEFSRGRPQTAVDFQVGKSTAKADWYSFQPAVLASSTAPASIAASPRKIIFTLVGTPARFYTLHVALLIEAPSVPALGVGINGKHGIFYLHPKLDLTMGDLGDAFIAVDSHADVIFRLPGSYLHRGSNTISLEAIEEAPQEVRDASFTYDAISLTPAAAPIASAPPAASIVPTVFYQNKQGQLDELVDAFIRFDGRPKAGSKVELTIGGKHYSESVTGNQDFGEGKFEFPTSEFTPGTKADLKWVSGGRKRHLAATVDPQKKWTLYLVPHMHLDVGFTDYQAKVAALQARALGEAMDFTKKTPDFRFSIDGFWSVAQYLRTRDAAQRERLITAMQKKQIFVPADYANLLTGFSTAETLIRSLYPSAEFSRLHGTPFNYASETDVPNYSWSYASILAAAGIKDLVAAANSDRAPVLLQGKLQYKSPMWWVGPDGKKILLWYSRNYLQMGVLFGQNPVIAAGKDTIPLFLQMYDGPNYLAHSTLIYGSQVENTDLFPGQATLAAKWNAIYAYPHVEYSGFHHALNAIAQQFNGHLPTIRGDGGPYWEIGFGSDAYYSTMERANESRGPSAEKLETLSSLINPGISPDRQRLKRMWRDMVMMDEHSFSSYNSETQPKSQQTISQQKVKNQFAVDAHALADWLSRNSMESIVNSISAGSNSLVVFNMLNWRRSGWASFDLPDGRELVDETTGQVVPYAIVFRGHRFNHVRFLAKDVPPVGYKAYLIRKADHPQPAPETSTDTTIESPWYRVVLDPADGAIESIYDKQLHRELVNKSSPYRFGQYLYVTGGDKRPNTLIEYRLVSPKPELTIHPAHNGKLISITRTPYGWVARMESSDTNTPKITTEVRVFEGTKKIELIEDVNKKYVLSKEGVYFAFPFVMDHPEFQYEIQNGVVNPARDTYPGAGHEWFSVQHWIAAQQNGVSAAIMPLDASLVTLGDIDRGLWPEQFGSRKGTIFSFVMNNYWWTNYPAAQGGHFRFRYVISSASQTDPAKLSRIGWEEMTPLEVDEVTEQDKAIDSPRPLRGKEGSFLDVDDPNLVFDTWKTAEDGHGTILRFLDLGGAARNIKVRVPLLHLTEAWLTDAVERNQKQLPLTGTDSFSFPIKPHEIVTIRLVGSAVSDRSGAEGN